MSDSESSDFPPAGLSPSPQTDPPGTLPSARGCWATSWPGVPGRPSRCSSPRRSPSPVSRPGPAGRPGPACRDEARPLEPVPLRGHRAAVRACLRPSGPRMRGHHLPGPCLRQRSQTGLRGCGGSGCCDDRHHGGGACKAAQNGACGPAARAGFSRDRPASQAQSSRYPNRGLPGGAGLGPGCGSGQWCGRAG